MFLRLQLAACLALLGGLACNSPLQPDRLQPPPGEPAHPITIRVPEKLSSVEAPDAIQGAQNVRVACVTCHSLRKTEPIPTSADELDEFHVGLRFAHGDLECASCHTQGRQDSLHLATGDKIPMTQAIRLCAQCHGTQWRDYQHGAHGGMTGHWDLSRGPRSRNHCVDCHDPHSPKFVGGAPVLPPRDRFLPAPESHR